MRLIVRRWARTGLALLILGAVTADRPAAQQTTPERLRAMPGFARVEAMREAQRTPPFDSGALAVRWDATGDAFEYVRDGRRWRFDVATREATPVAGAEGAAAAASAAAEAGLPDGGGPPPVHPCPPAVVERGRQRACEPSPDGRRRATSRDRNVYVSNADGTGEIAVTSDGTDANRIKYGTASWVYGEELDQTTAMWWSPDGTRLAFYRFDEHEVPDYYVTFDQLADQTTVDVEAFPLAGTPNPRADLFVFDTRTGETTTLDVRDGQPFTDDVVGHYVYGVGWAADGSEVRLFRTDRRQQVRDLVGCDPATGRCRVIIHEAVDAGWLENSPTVRMLADGRRFIWASDRTGWRNYYLADVDTGVRHPITTRTDGDVEDIVRIDEAAGVLFYMARDGDTPLKLQLHRVGLDGRGDVRLTDPRFTHAVSLSPDGRAFVDVYQAHDVPPATRLVDADGQVVADLARSDLSRFEQLGLRPAEHFEYLAADGRTRLTGALTFPSDFDPSRTYPVLVSVYAGPESSSRLPSEVFRAPTPLTEYGFLLVTLMTRAAPGLGRTAREALYEHLGRTEIDDLAAGVRALAHRPYVDRHRIGIYGTSYGGYAALLALLRYPDLFAAASAASPVGDWRLYDTIYTERYMWTPQGNADGYDAGSPLRYVDQLRGRLLLYFGTADNNVHPANSLRLVDAFARAGKSVDLAVGVDLGHSAVPEGRMLEFFVENLIVRPERLFVERPEAP